MEWGKDRLTCERLSVETLVARLGLDDKWLNGFCTLKLLCALVCPLETAGILIATTWVDEEQLDDADEQRDEARSPVSSSSLFECLGNTLVTEGGAGTRWTIRNVVLRDTEQLAKLDNASLLCKLASREVMGTLVGCGETLEDDAVWWLCCGTQTVDFNKQANGSIMVRLTIMHSTSKVATTGLVDMLGLVKSNQRNFQKQQRNKLYKLAHSWMIQKKKKEPNNCKRMLTWLAVRVIVAVLPLIPLAPPFNEPILPKVCASLELETLSFPFELAFAFPFAWKRPMPLANGWRSCGAFITCVARRLDNFCNMFGSLWPDIIDVLEKLDNPDEVEVSLFSKSSLEVVFCLVMLDRDVLEMPTFPLLLSRRINKVWVSVRDIVG